MANTLTLEVKKDLTQKASAQYQSNKDKYKSAAKKVIDSTMKGPASGIILLANRVSMGPKATGFEACFANIARQGIYRTLSDGQMNVLKKAMPRKAGYLGYLMAKDEVYTEHFKNSK